MTLATQLCPSWQLRDDSFPVNINTFWCWTEDQIDSRSDKARVMKTCPTTFPNNKYIFPQITAPKRVNQTKFNLLLCTLHTLPTSTCLLFVVIICPTASAVRTSLANCVHTVITQTFMPWQRIAPCGTPFPTASTPSGHTNTCHGKDKRRAALSCQLHLHRQDTHIHAMARKVRSTTQ